LSFDGFCGDNPVSWGVCELNQDGLSLAYSRVIDEVTGQPPVPTHCRNSPWTDLVLFFFLKPIAAPVKLRCSYFGTSFVGRSWFLSRAKHQGQLLGQGRHYNRFVPWFFGVASEALATVIARHLEGRCDKAIGEYIFVWNHCMLGERRRLGYLGFMLQYLSLAIFSLRIGDTMSLY